jgi:hypothetical protein
MFGLLLPWLFGRGWPTWPWWLAVTFALPALVAPMALRPVYRGWMRLARVLNRVMTPLILAVLFYGLFTPVALVMKLIGRDPLRRKLDPAADTYRIDVSDRPPSDLDRPF